MRRGEARREGGRGRGRTKEGGVGRDQGAVAVTRTAGSMAAVGGVDV